jgi:hypothetical protein
MAVKTGPVDSRRALRFSSYQEMIDCARGLSEVPTRQLGNWSLGQICQHLAVAIDASIDGAPFKPAMWLRVFGPLVKKRYLTRPMHSGFQLPANATALIPGETSTADGIAALEKSIGRLAETSVRKPHAVFGKLTRDEWDQLQLRHAEMHLGFIVPR